MNITTGNKFWLSQATAFIPTDKPIIFWDTCALLDILRIPLFARTQLNAQTFQAYEQIRSWIETDRLVSITSELVVREFGEHADDCVIELMQQEQKIKDSVKEQTQYMVNMLKARNLCTKIDDLDISKRVVKLVKKIWKSTYILKGQKSFALHADYRVRNYIKPSGGKESYKDCYIWISYISLINKVISTEPTFFFTTNPADFAENKGSAIMHSHLLAELPFAQSSYALNMASLNGRLIQYFNAHP